MANSFGQQLKAFAEKTGEKLEAVDVGFKFELFNKVTQRTPVDTGRLKGNWQISNGAPALGVNENLFSKVPFGTASLGPAEEAQIQPFASTYLTNNLIYGPAMEIKYGMVDLAIAEARQALAEAVRDD